MSQPIAAPPGTIGPHFGAGISATAAVTPGDEDNHASISGGVGLGGSAGIGIHPNKEGTQSLSATVGVGLVANGTVSVCATKYRIVNAFVPAPVEAFLNAIF
jgi:hypothetical protein